MNYTGTDKESRVFVTGIGINGPNFVGVPQLVSYIENVQKISNTTLSKEYQKLGSSLESNKRTGLVADDKKYRNFDKNSIMASLAADDALQDFGNDFAVVDQKNTAVCLGTFASTGSQMSDFDESVYLYGPRRCEIGIFPNTVMCAPASRISILNKLMGMNATICSGKNSGLDAIGLSYLKIKSGNAKIALCGGADMLSEKILKVFDNQNLMLDEKNSANKKNRNRFIPTEGAGVLILTSGSVASQKKYCEIISYGMSFSGAKWNNVNDRSRDLKALALKSLSEAMLGVDDIDALIISGSFGTNDEQVEVLAIREIFFTASKVQTVAILDIKKIIGESFSAHGAYQVALATYIIKSHHSRSLLSRLNINPLYKNSAIPIKNIMIFSVDPFGHMSILILKGVTSDDD